MQRLSLLATVAVAGSVLTACGGSGSSTAPSSYPNVSGTWNYHKIQTDTAHSIVCTDSGTINIVQSDSTFGGTYQQDGQCVAPDTTANDAASGLVVNGHILSNQLLFSADACDYTGTMSSGSKPDSLKGTGTCSFVDQDTTYHFDVQWSAGH